MDSGRDVCGGEETAHGRQGSACPKACLLRLHEDTPGLCSLPESGWASWLKVHLVSSKPSMVWPILGTDTVDAHQRNISPSMALHDAVILSWAFH